MPTTLTRVTHIARSGSSDVVAPPAGWVGSKLGTRGDIVTLSSGAVDQSHAAGSTIADATRIAWLAGNVASTVAAGALIPIEKFDDDTEVELPIADSGNGTLGVPGAVSTPSTTMPTLVGVQRGITRATDGTYYVNNAVTTTASCKVEIVRLGTRYPVEGFMTVICKVLPGARVNQ